MRITFVLPAPVRVPIGGAAVVYRHAEGLVRRGHSVAVVAPRRSGGRLVGAARQVAVGLRDRLHGVAPAGVYAAEGVETVEVDRIDGGTVPPGDAVIATGFQTVTPVLALPAECGARVHFVQGDETFIDPDARSAWRLPFARVACSAWLADAVRAEGGTCLGVVENAADPAFFACDVEGARAPSVLALYHRHAVKGPDVLVRALTRIGEARLDVQADVFCARRPSHRLPPAVRVHVRPDRTALRALYARAAVFLHTSRSEGWGLTAMEAGASGCAVVATRNRGVESFLSCGDSMRCVATGDADALADEALDVLGQPDERRRLGRAARERTAAFRWDDLTDRFEALLVRAVEERGAGRVGP